MILCAPGMTIKTKKASQTLKFKKQPKDVTQHIYND